MLKNIFYILYNRLKDNRKTHTQNPYIQKNSEKKLPGHHPALKASHEGQSLPFFHPRPLVPLQPDPPVVGVAAAGADLAALTGGQAAADTGQQPVQRIPVPTVEAPADPVGQIDHKAPQTGLQKTILPENTVLGLDAGPIVGP